MKNQRIRYNRNRFNKAYLFFSFAAILGVVPLKAASPAPLPFEPQLQSKLPKWIASYKELHQNPELSYHERRTAVKMFNHLEKLNFKVTEGIGGNGVVGVLRNGSGPTVMIRTDMDALPIVEETGLPYASTIITKDDTGAEVGVMHACGHDVHMSVWMGTTEMMSELKSSWSGTLVALAQPAEEKGAGAKAMLDDGLYERFPTPDYAVAMHVDSQSPAGTVGVVKGFALANVDSVNITIKGVGGHGAYPHSTRDPVILSAQIILALQTIVSREIDPTQPAVVTVGSIHGGTKHNIIPDAVHLQLTLRSYTDEVRNTVIDAIKRIVEGQARAAGIPDDLMPTVDMDDVYTPATYNDPLLTERIVKSLDKSIGSKNVLTLKPVMGGEDFGRYGRTKHKVPVCMLWLGAVDPELHHRFSAEGIKLPSLHSSKFAPLPEPSILTGVTAMTQILLDLLK